MTRALLALLLLTGCPASGDEAPVETSAVIEEPAQPAGTKYCPRYPETPPEPPLPRTVEQVLTWAGELEAALVATQAARDECRRRLGRLNEWIESQKED
jgi:hypothetical protein